jgi:chemotaxis protein MotD
MNKLIGTSGQLFSVIAEINSRGTVRSGKGTGGQGTPDSSFRNLLHSVSNRAKRASSDHEGSVNPRSVRPHVSQLEEGEQLKDDIGRERLDAAKESDPSNKVRLLDQKANVHVQSGVANASILGQEHAIVPELTARAQQPRNESGRAAGRDLAGASAMMDSAAHSGTRASVVAAPQEATASQNSVAPTTTSAGAGFEAIVANVERVANVSVHHAVPEATKVTVLQQETHFPPVAQFTAPQQIANGVVAELNGSSASASSSPPDLASAQTNAPDQPLKILTISLDPPALGNVTVRLRLTGNAVSVHLAADRRDTSQLLDQQRDSIRELMRSAGYVADVAPVQHGTLDGFQAGSGQSQPSLSGQQQSSHPQGTLDSFGQQQGEAKQTRQERHHNQETRHEQDVVSHNSRGAIFV